MKSPPELGATFFERPEARSVTVAFAPGGWRPVLARSGADQAQEPLPDRPSPAERAHDGRRAHRWPRGSAPSGRIGSRLVSPIGNWRIARWLNLALAIVHCTGGAQLVATEGGLAASCHDDEGVVATAAMNCGHPFVHFPEMRPYPDASSHLPTTNYQLNPPMQSQIVNRESLVQPRPFKTEWRFGIISALRWI